MKVTKFEQSCLLIEDGGIKILIDPGFPFTDKHDISELGKLDAVLITHEHPDHFEQSIGEKLTVETDVYVNESTAEQLTGPTTTVKDGQLVKIGSLDIKVIELPHCLMPDGSEGPQNVGYLINDTLFHPGDGIEIDGLSVANLALPIIGPDISPMDSFRFAQQVSAKKALAIHYDTWGANTDYYQDRAKATNQPFELLVLAPGESVEI